jgi:cytochrome subunit of sulfide dehydrogenase
MPSAASFRRSPSLRLIGRGGFAIATAVSLALGSGGLAVAQDAPSGALSCSGCHGPPGTGGAVASLAGRPAEEIVAALTQFRRGERAATVMDRIAKGFTDDEIHAIAEWLAGGGEQSARNSQP